MSGSLIRREQEQLDAHFILQATTAKLKSKIDSLGSSLERDILLHETNHQMVAFDICYIECSLDMIEETADDERWILSMRYSKRDDIAFALVRRGGILRPDQEDRYAKL